MTSPKKRRLGLPRILSRASARGFSSRSEPSAAIATNERPSRRRRESGRAVAEFLGAGVECRWTEPDAEPEYGDFEHYYNVDDQTEGWCSRCSYETRDKVM